MNRIRVLVVDDSVVVRRLISEVLNDDPLIEVIATASTGRLGVAKVNELRPDLVTLGIEMPEMNGLEALREIRKAHPRLPVIMFSTLTRAGATATLDALTLGASDYVTKPSKLGDAAEVMAAIRRDLTPKVHALCRPGHVRRQNVIAAHPSQRAAAPTPPPAAGAAHPRAPLDQFRRPAAEAPAPHSPAPVVRRSVRSGRVEAVLIGCSTGGPNALAAIWARLPRDLPVPVLITQHMPPTFTTLFAERLSKIGTLPVVEATDGTMLRPGAAVVAPGDHHLALDPHAPTGRVRLNQHPPVHSCRPAVDPMFRSAVGVFGGNVLAVILTGMGADGTDGCRAVHAAGGRVVVQDEASSVVWGMPGSVAHAGLADAVLPLDRIAEEIIQRVGHGRLTTSRGGR